jgi:hypothetical protein
MINKKKSGGNQMQASHKVRWGIWIFFILLFAGIIFQGLTKQNSTTLNSSQVGDLTTLRTVNKIVLGALLLLAFLAFLIVPKTGLAKKMRLTEGVYNFYCILGTLCGFCGLIATILWPHLIIKTHLMWLIVMPWVLDNFYVGIILKIQKTSDFGDEKQNLNMGAAGGITMGFTIPVMAGLFILYERNVLQGSIWFPYYFFTTIFVFSIMTLHLFKNE